MCDPLQIQKIQIQTHCRSRGWKTLAGIWLTMGEGEGKSQERECERRNHPSLKYWRYHWGGKNYVQSKQQNIYRFCQILLQNHDGLFKIGHYGGKPYICKSVSLKDPEDLYLLWTQPTAVWYKYRKIWNNSKCKGPKLLFSSGLCLSSTPVWSLITGQVEATVVQYKVYWREVIRPLFRKDWPIFLCIHFT